MEILAVIGIIAAFAWPAPPSTGSGDHCSAKATTSISLIHAIPTPCRRHRATGMWRHRDGYTPTATPACSSTRTPIRPDTIDMKRR